METNHEDEGKGVKFILPDKISEHISLSEATRSDAAVRAGIANLPNEQAFANIKMWAEKVFEPLREYVSLKRGKDSPLIINSIYRNIEVNKLIKGSPTSSHCAGDTSKIEEAAGDIEAHYPDFTNKDLFMLVKEKGAWDQLIWEFGNEKQPAWVHIGFRKQNNRKQILKAISENGQTKYIPFA